MTDQTKLLFAIQQIENISNLIEGNRYETFMVSHLVSLKVELKRQMVLINAGKEIV